MEVWGGPTDGYIINVNFLNMPAAQCVNYKGVQEGETPSSTNETH